MAVAPLHSDRRRVARIGFQIDKVLSCLSQTGISARRHLLPVDPSLASIAAIRPGDAVHLIRDGNRWRIDNAQGQTPARRSRAFAPPDVTTFPRGEVAAILNWWREDGDEDYHHLLRRDECEVVLPELVFA